MPKKKTDSDQIEIRQVVSVNGKPGLHRRTLRALGIKKNQTSVVHTDTPAIRGMIRQVSHLVEVTPVQE